MDITSHEHGNVIDPTQDLTITWDGGKDDGMVAVRMMPLALHKKGRKDRLHFDRIIIKILVSNTGEYTFSSAQIQELLSNVDSAHLMVGVSQMDIGEVEHDGKVFHSVMRNGNSVKLKVE
jgi:hypothetical protein